MKDLHLYNVTKPAMHALIQKGFAFLPQIGLHITVLIPDEEWNEQTWLAGGKTSFMVRGITLMKKQVTYNGRIDQPQRFEKLEGGLVYYGVDKYQCHICGYWLDNKMTFEDERRHDESCQPRYQWELVSYA